MSQTLEQVIIDLWENEDEQIEIIDNGKWRTDVKYEHRDTIVKFIGRYFAIAQSRSGSYFTDYEYCDPMVYEVEPKQVTVTQWVEKKEAK